MKETQGLENKILLAEIFAYVNVSIFRLSSGHVSY